MHLLRFARVITVAAAVAFVSLWPMSAGGTELFPQADKAGHFAMYALLSFVLVRTVKPDEIKTVKLKVFIIVFCAFYGLLIEILQELMPYGRTFEWLDAFANLAGALVGVVINAVFFKNQ